MRSLTVNLHYTAIGLFALAALTTSGCSFFVTEEGETTQLNPAGPPMVQQVLMQERVVVDDMGNTRIRTQLAFGTHPEILDEDSLPGVTSAIARDNQKIRVILDELLLGNYLEEVACDGLDEDNDQIFSRIPPNATPDDLNRCSPPELSKCSGDNAICVVNGEAIGVLDTEENGAPDQFRMIRYPDGDLAVRMFCDGGDGTLGNADDVSIPLDQNASFYNPSGNQLLPAGPCGADCLGPALVLIPEDGMRSGSACGISFQDTVIDKDLNQICAPPNGDLSQDCAAGDTTAVSWEVEPLRLLNTFPADGDVGIDVSTQILLVFNASMDQASLANITTTATPGGNVDVVWVVSADDPKSVTGSVNLVGGTTYEVTIPSTVTDRFGGPLPMPTTLTFSTP